MRWGLILPVLLSLGFKPLGHPLISLINDYRARWNASPLTEDHRLHCAAQYQLDHILNTRTCTQLGLHGETVRDRAVACGYPWTTGEQFLLCQYLSADVWFNTLHIYPQEYRSVRDHAWQKVGIAENQYWWVLILAR